MKISPLKNYVKPGYAVKLAALLTAAAAVSGCAEGGAQNRDSQPAGAGYHGTTSGTTTENNDVQGMFPAIEETTSASSGAAVSETDGNTTTTLETTAAEIEAAALEGDVAFIEETTAATTSCCPEDTQIAGTFVSTEDEYEEAVLDGEVDIPDEETMLEGDVYIPDEETVLEGLMEAPETDWEIERISTAEDNFDPLREAFSKYENLRFSLIEDYEYDDSCRFVLGDPDGNETEFIAPYLIEIYDEDGMYWKKCAYATFITPDDPFAEVLKQIPGKKLEGGYLAENSFFTFKMLFIEAGPNGHINSDDFCENLAADFAKEVGAV